MVYVPICMQCTVLYTVLKSRKLTFVILFLQGQAGNWKENISEQLSRDIDEKFAKDMEGMDINFTYSL